MNIYRYRFTAKCPADGQQIQYQLEIRTDDMIMAEDIVKHCNHADGYQEYIASKLKEKLGGSVKLTGTHSGVEIISEL